MMSNDEENMESNIDLDAVLANIMNETKSTLDEIAAAAGDEEMIMSDDPSHDAMSADKGGGGIVTRGASS